MPQLIFSISKARADLHAVGQIKDDEINMAVALLGEILKITVIAGLSLAGILIIHFWMRNLSRKISYLRIFIQIVSQVALFYLIAFPLWLSLVVVTLLFMTFVFGR